MIDAAIIFFVAVFGAVVWLRQPKRGKVPRRPKTTAEKIREGRELFANASWEAEREHYQRQKDREQWFAARQAARDLMHREGRKADD